MPASLTNYFSSATNVPNAKIGDLEINPFSISHDAANPCGFNIYNNNSKVSIATDLGHIDDRIFKNLKE